MKLAEGIRRRGFRKWYEHQLMVSHGYLALTFVCMVGVFGAMDAVLQVSSWRERSGELLTAALSIAVGLWALRRYMELFQQAEVAANQADCPACKTYGRLELVQSDGSGDQVQVRCRKCAHVWRIEA